MALPSLNYLRPFEATGRLGSTVRAGDELGRTHSAVSRQIGCFERWLGVKLFSRDCGRLRLTEEGARYHGAISHVLSLLDQATSSLADDGCRNVVRVHGPTVFMSRWLIPRINRFYAKYPKLEVSISDFSRNPEPTIGPCDVAISLEPGDWPDMEIVPLMSDLIFPVCNSNLESQIDGGETPVPHRLLHGEDCLTHWPSWLRSVGLPAPEPGRGLHMAAVENVLQAAANGHGLALARGQLVMDDLDSGKLVRPMPQVTKVEEAYWLIRPKYGSVSSTVRAFTGWLREEANLSSKRLAESFAQPSESAPAARGLNFRSERASPVCRLN